MYPSFTSSSPWFIISSRTIRVLLRFAFARSIWRVGVSRVFNWPRGPRHAFVHVFLQVICGFAAVIAATVAVGARAPLHGADFFRRLSPQRCWQQLGRLLSLLMAQAAWFFHRHSWQLLRFEMRAMSRGPGRRPLGEEICVLKITNAASIKSLYYTLHVWNRSM